MKVYKGWIVEIEGAEYVTGGSITIRGNTSYYLTDADGDVSTIKRSTFLDLWDSGDITYKGNA